MRVLGIGFIRFEDFVYSLEITINKKIEALIKIGVLPSSIKSMFLGQKKYEQIRFVGSLSKVLRTRTTRFKSASLNSICSIGKVGCSYMPYSIKQFYSILQTKQHSY
jgi:hypothetical protein